MDVQTVVWSLIIIYTFLHNCGSIFAVRLIHSLLDHCWAKRGIKMREEWPRRDYKRWEKVEEKGGSVQEENEIEKIETGKSAEIMY